MGAITYHCLHSPFDWEWSQISVITYHKYMETENLSMSYIQMNYVAGDDLLWQLPLTNFRRNGKGQMQQEICCNHDDVTFSASLAFMRGIHWSPMNSPHKGQWRRALTFFIYVWINCCVNNREAGDLRRHCADYDVTVVIKGIPPQLILKLTSNLFVAKMCVFVQFWPSDSIDAVLCAKF